MQHIVTVTLNITAPTAERARQYAADILAGRKQSIDAHSLPSDLIIWDDWGLVEDEDDEDVPVVRTKTYTYTESPVITHEDMVESLTPVQRARYDTMLAEGMPRTLALEHADHDHGDGGCIDNLPGAAWLADRTLGVSTNPAHPVPRTGGTGLGATR